MIIPWGADNAGNLVSDRPLLSVVGVGVGVGVGSGDRSVSDSIGNDAGIPVSTTGLTKSLPVPVVSFAYS